MTDTAAPAEQTPQQWTGPVVAGPGQYYRNMRYLMCVVFIGMGAWFGYDGWVAWPRMNEQIRQLTAQRHQAIAAGDAVRSKMLLDELTKLNGGKEKTAWDLGLQKGLCVAMPLLGVFVLARALYRSRGEYRLDGTTLSIPGHPPVPFENITEIDRRLWDKKGIAFVHYDLGDGRKGRITLDDFIYDRPPTDEIYRRIEEYVDPQTKETVPPAPQSETSQPDQT